jgi:hypothetical protein
MAAFRNMTDPVGVLARRRQPRGLSGVPRQRAALVSGSLSAVAVLLLAACSPQPMRTDTGPGAGSACGGDPPIGGGDHGFDAPPYQIPERDPLMVFFLTYTGSSPDPYCGYESAQPGSAPVPDPLGSGAGRAEDLGNGWYWLCAS